MEDIDYRAARGLDKTVVRALVKDSAWLRNRENIFVIGLAVATGFLRQGQSDKALAYAAALLRDLALARADGSLRHFL